MSASAPAREPRRAGVPIHPLAVRITHWLNAIAILIMIGSGWRNWNSSALFDFHSPVGITWGGDMELSQDVHNETGLAGALQWHFAAMWLFVLNGLAYFVYGIISGRFRQTMFPVGPAAFVRDAMAALQFRLPHRLGVYNAVQKTLYLGVLAVGVIMVLSGLAIWKPGQFQELTWLFGGFDVARVIHFLGMAGIVLFLVVHAALVIMVPKRWPTMTTGRAPANAAHGED